MSLSATEKVRVAHALVGLPQIAASMARGELSYSKVRALSRVACPATEEALIGAHRDLSDLEEASLARLAAQAVDDGGGAAALQLALEASDLSDAQAEQPRGLGLGPLPAVDGVQDLEDITFPLAHGYPV